MDNIDPSVTDDTVQRKPPLKADDIGSTEDLQKNVPFTGTPSSEDESGLEEAKTVIRQLGSSRSPNQLEEIAASRSPADVAQVLVGQQLNQYHLDQMIGGGGMGAVFRAHDQQLDRIVALKVIPFVGNDPELQRRFRNEAQNAAKLDHPRIARVFDAGAHQAWHYIVFEYIQGTNLRDLIQSHGPLTLDDAVYMTIQVAEALDHASQRGIVHRDIKPSNLLVAEDGNVKLVDMGLARSDNLELSEDMTASGVTLGTFDYISPEQALDPRDADLRSDIYSLGCTFYYMLTGEAPYHGGTMLQKLLSHGNAPLPDPREIRASLPDEFIAVMHRMMAKEPKSRYQNTTDLLADLNELAIRFRLKRAKSISGYVAPVTNEGLQRVQVHLPWVIAAVLVFVIAGYIELQSIASRDGFKVGDAPPTATSIRISGGSEAESIGGAVSEELDNTEVGTASGPGSDAGANVLSPSNASDSAVLGSPPDVDNRRITESDVSAPPTITDIPMPQEISRSEGTSQSTAGATGATVNAEMESSADPLVRAGAEASESVNSVVATPNGAVADEPATTASEAIALPSPEVVRIVSPSLIALSTRVDDVDRDDDGAILASNLSDAMDLATRFGVLNVELTTAEIVTGPIEEIPFDNMTFRSTVGRTVVRMVSPKLLTIGRSDMIAIGNRRVRFENIDFHWELADDQVDGAAMFVINDNRLVRFDNCSLTIVNPAIHDHVCFFSVVTDPDALPDNETLPGRLFNPNLNALPLVAIQLDNVVVRGEADFIDMDYAAALQLMWNNGLLAISGRMIETDGAKVRPSLVSSPILISLNKLTADIPRGMLRLRLDGEGIYPVPIERKADQCVFVVDPDQPHFDVIGVDSLELQQDLLRIDGKSNAYDVDPSLTDPLLSVSDLGGNAVVYTMADLLTDTLPWCEERPSIWSVYWTNRVRPALAYHRLAPADYRQDGAVYGGFDESALPDLQ